MCRLIGIKLFSLDYFDDVSYQKTFWLAAADRKDVWLNKVGSLIGHLTVGLIDIFVQHYSTFKTKFLVCCYCSKFYIFKVKFCFIVKTVLVFAALLGFATFMLNTFGVSMWGFILYCFIIFVFLSMSILNLEFLNWRFETVYNFITFLFDCFSSKEIDTFFKRNRDFLYFHATRILLKHQFFITLFKFWRKKQCMSSMLPAQNSKI